MEVMELLFFCFVALLLILHVIDTEKRFNKMERTVGRILHDLILHGSIQVTPEFKAEYEFIDGIHKAYEATKKKTKKD